MTLTLTIIEQPRGAVQSQAGHVVRRGGTIVGRSTACDWILADPKRSLSRRHCLIERRPEGFCLLDLSANGVFVNDAAQPLGPEGVHRLADGDELRLGEYRLAVRCVTALLPGPDGEEDHAEPPTCPPAAVAPPTPEAQGRRAALEALLGGAELKGLQVEDADVEALLHTAGALLRHTIAGAMVALAARNEAKVQRGEECTLHRPLQQNPLKVFPVTEVDGALRQLLKNRADPVFLAPLAAVQEGFEDLRAHQLAVNAGTQAALEQVLDRFSPEQLAHLLPRPSRLERWLLGNRSDSRWRAYRRRYQQLASQVEEDFARALKNFAAAYEVQARTRAAG